MRELASFDSGICPGLLLYLHESYRDLRVKNSAVDFVGQGGQFFSFIVLR